MVYGNWNPFSQIKRGFLWQSKMVIKLFTWSLIFGIFITVYRLSMVLSLAQQGLKKSLKFHGPEPVENLSSLIKTFLIRRMKWWKYFIRWIVGQTGGWNKPYSLCSKLFLFKAKRFKLVLKYGNKQPVKLMQLSMEVNLLIIKR